MKPRRCGLTLALVRDLGELRTPVSPDELAELHATSVTGVGTHDAAGRIVVPYRPGDRDDHVAGLLASGMAVQSRSVRSPGCRYDLIESAS